MKFDKKSFLFAFLATTILYIPSVGNAQPTGQTIVTTGENDVSLDAGVFLPSSDNVVVDRRQSAIGVGNPATATFSMQPTEGNLLVAMSGHRKSTGDNYISGSGWTQNIVFNAYSTYSYDRRGMSIWTKIAGASEPTNISVDFGTEGNRLIIQEFTVTDGEFSAIDAIATNLGSTAGTTSISTGTTPTTTSEMTLVLSGLVIRDSTPNVPSWTNGLSDAIGVSAVTTTYPSLFTAYTVESTSSSKQSTASWDNSRGASAAIIAYGITPATSVGDLVWNDLDGDGVQDVGEPGLNGVPVILYTSGGTQIATTTTNSNGNYSFTGIAPDNYYIKFIPPAGFIYSPQDQTSEDYDSDANTSTGQTSVTSLSVGENDVSWDAGMHEPAQIGDFVWNDIDQDGVQDIGESGMANVSVSLYNSGGSLAGSATTNAAGYYSFEKIAGGNYYLVFTLPGGYSFSPQDQTGDTSDSDANTSTGQTSVTLLSAGENDPTWDAGMYPTTASIGDYVWIDVDKDGIQDGDESGKSDVTVQLYHSDGTLSGSTITDGSGAYSFTGIMPGSYYVVFTLPSGYYFSPQDQTSDDYDSDANTSTGQTAITVLISGENDVSWDAGVFVPSSGDAAVERRQWAMGEGNAATATFSMTPTEGNLLVAISGHRKSIGNNYISGSGWTQNVYYNTYSTDSGNRRGMSIWTKIAGASEPTSISVDFGNEGNRLIIQEFTVTDGEFSAIDAVATNMGSTVETTSISTGTTSTTTSEITFVLSGLVTRDSTPNVPSWTNGLTNTIGENDNGLYPSLYTAYTVDNTSSAKQSTASWDYSRDASAAIITYGITSSGSSSSYPASIGDYVWHDIDKDGIQDEGEIGKSGVTVQLYQSDGTFSGSTTTDGSGSYSFTDITPGSYYVVFTLPGGYVFSPQNQTSDGNDSDANTSTGQTATTVLISGENDVSWDAGLYEDTSCSSGTTLDHYGSGNIEGVVQIDVPNIENVNETTIEVVYKTCDAGNDIIVNTSVGNITVPKVYHSDYGAYVYRTTLSGGVTNIYHDYECGSNSANSGLQSMIVYAERSVPTPSSYQSIYTENGGYCNIKNISISIPTADDVRDVDLVLPFSEMTDDGRYITVTASSNTGSASASETIYGSDLSLGKYLNIVELTIPDVPANSTAINISVITDGANNPSGSGACGQSWVMAATIIAEVECPGLAASVGDYVWLDSDKDGIQDGDEQGFENVTVNLYGTDSSIISSTITNSAGEYSFSRLMPGSYYIDFILPYGYSFSPSGQTSDSYDSDANPTNGQTSIITIGAGEDAVIWDAGMFETPQLGSDFGDLPDSYKTLLASNGAKHNIDGSTYLGAIAPDHESDGQETPNALGDDNNNIDDDDGVTFITPLLPNVVDALLLVKASVAGYLNAWVDFNDDGDFEDTSEQIASDLELASGMNPLLISQVPSTAKGAIKSRFRFTSGSGQATTSYGNAPNGEVEDYALASIGNFVWDDLDANGIQDSGEHGLNGVVVQLYDESGQFLVMTSSINNPSSGEPGWYEFPGIIPGTYHLQFNLPGGFSFSPQDIDSDETDSDANPSTGKTVQFSLTQGQVNDQMDAGFIRQTYVDFGDLPDGPYPTYMANDGARHVIGGSLFLGLIAPDAETNAQSNSSATGDDADGTDDEDGVTFLSPLHPGRPSAIEVITSAVGYLNAWIDFNGDGDFDDYKEKIVSDLMVNSGINTVTISEVPNSAKGITASRFRISSEAGLSYTGQAPDGEVEDYVLGSIGDFVWVDSNDNGIQDDGEDGKNLVTVKLLDNYGYPVLDAADNPITTSTMNHPITDKPGWYVFPGLLPGGYIVEFVLPSGYGFSPQDIGNDDYTDSEVNVTTGRTAIINLEAGNDLTNIDAGLQQTAQGQISGEPIDGFAIKAAYPNPFNPVTTIEYGLESAGEVHMAIYDISGRLVNTLVNEQKESGWYRIQWNGLTKDESPVPAGMYLCVVRSGNYTRNIKLMLVK